MLKAIDFLALQYVHDARFSPDGRRVAYIVSRTEENRDHDLFDVLIETLATGERRSLGFAGRAIHVRWSPDGRRLAFIGQSDGRSRLYVADADGTARASVVSAGDHLVGPPSWSVDGTTLVGLACKSLVPQSSDRIIQRIFTVDGAPDLKRVIYSVYLLNINSGSTCELSVDQSGIEEAMLSPCGKRLLLLHKTGQNHRASLGVKLAIVDLITGCNTEVLDDRWYVAAAAWCSDGKHLVLSGDFQSTMPLPLTRLWTVDCDGSHASCRSNQLVEHIGVFAHHDMPTWTTSQNRSFTVVDGAVYATVTRGGRAEIWRIGLDGPVSCERVVFGDRTCVIMDVHSKTSKLLYCVTDARKPWELYAFDLSTGIEKSITRLNDFTLAAWPAMEIEHLEFMSDDGVALEGWYLRRKECADEPLPTVMFIHGGPELNSGYAFRFDFHLLAAAGYGVLFANFRGSSGYGESFRRAIQGNWGAKGFPDHMAAMDAAVSGGFADQARLGVWGPSHGGLAVCWIVTHTDRFRAAVAESAVTNFTSLYYLSDLPDIFAAELGGRPDEIPDVYRACSPLTYAMRCRTPTLLIHGQEDRRCPIVEAEQFYRALHDAGCPTELVRVPGMTHMGDSVGPLSARLAQNEALLSWFVRYL